jgi:hypothetical protein
MQELNRLTKFPFSLTQADDEVSRNPIPKDFMSVLQCSKMSSPTIGASGLASLHPLEDLGRCRIKGYAHSFSARASKPLDVLFAQGLA